MEKVIVSRDAVTSDKIKVLTDNINTPQFTALRTAVSKKHFKLEWLTLDAGSVDAWLVTCGCYPTREFTEADNCYNELGTKIHSAGSTFKAPKAREWADSTGIKTDSFQKVDVSFSLYLPGNMDGTSVRELVEGMLKDSNIDAI